MNRGKPTIILHGSFMGSNYGDVLFCELFYRITKDLLPEANILIPYADDYFYPYSDYKKKASIGDLFKADAIIFCPGGYFGQPNRRVFYWLLRLFKRHLSVCLLTLLRRIPFGIIGVGVGPISFLPARFIIKKMFNDAVVTSVRDEESLKYLKSWRLVKNVPVTVDAAVAFMDYMDNDINCDFIDEFISPFINFHKVFIHLNIPQNSEKYKIIVEDLILALQKDNNMFYIIGTDSQGKDQKKYVESLRHYFPVERSCIYIYKNHYELSSLISRIDFIITTKLHVGIIGTSFNKSVLSVSNHQKIPRYYHQIGIPERTVELVTLKSGDMVSLINKFAYKPYIMPSVIKQCSRKNYKLVASFIDSIYVFR